MAIPPYVFCHFAAKSAVKSVGGKHYFPSGYSVPSKTENEHITQSPWLLQHALRNCILSLNFTKNLAILNFLKCRTFCISFRRINNESFHICNDYPLSSDAIG